MGKNRDRESLIRIIANILVHEILARHTNKPESSQFLESEIIEYRSQAERASDLHNWNDEDRKEAEEAAFKQVKDKLSGKYSDVSYAADHTDKKILLRLKELIAEMM